ncbi:cyclase family protein [Dethiosulfovibrio sp. F2B]|uniref:cyclase family protein n=1 Tax=Dethiosulfovibrio faecalis TaxID=2720018 RepID=UPI001F24C20D|nr:cyclase family protein [Dethiosulfovibrio faecalis]
MIVLNVVDLTQVIREGMPVYPGTEPPKIVQATTVKKEGFAEKLITMFSHTGTHMDAPAHILKEGATLDQISADRFVGRAVVADFSGLSGTIGLSELERYGDDLEGCDFFLYRTGWSDMWGKAEYFEGFPVLSIEACEWIVDKGIKGIGVDAISVDPVDSLDLPNHRVFLGAGMVIVENLTGLEDLPSSVTLCCLPLKIADSDGAPVRAVALLDS